MSLMDTLKNLLGMGGSTESSDMGGSMETPAPTTPDAGEQAPMGEPQTPDMPQTGQM